MSKHLWKSAFLVVAFAVPVEGQEVTDYERFQLFTECAPLKVLAPISGEEAEEIGLTQNRILTMAESRLPAARLWSDGLSVFLSIGVAVFRGAYAYKVAFTKWAYDSSGGQHMAQTWVRPSAAWPAIGTHGGDAGFIMQSLSEELDAFILEYLRVNEESC